MASQFSKDGKYFAQLTEEGKIKIWNTFSNTFDQEFTPDFHLTSACTCLHFLDSSLANKHASPRKKRRKNSVTEAQTCLALGTSSGRLLMYSLTKADLEFTIDSATSQSINCLSLIDTDLVYSGTDTDILVWNLNKRNTSKWSTGNEKIFAILAIPDGVHLVTASKALKLWNARTRELLKTFTGHSSQVSLLHYISPHDETAESYLISGSKADRYLSCWSLSESSDGKHATASFLMEDVISNVSVNIDNDRKTNIAATVRSGVVHIYQHTLNGKKANKPVKPKTTVQVACDSKEKGVSVIKISSAVYRDAETVCISYGSPVVRVFEDVKISTYKKLDCLIREDPHNRTRNKQVESTKTRLPVIESDVHYLSTQSSASLKKRRNDGQQEIPMERRLENLLLKDDDGSTKVPTANNLAQLLVQALHSKDKSMLRTVLFKKDEQLIANTVKKMPVTLIAPLFEELTKIIQGKTFARQIGLMWLRNLTLIHSGFLLSNPELSTMFGEALASIEAGLALQASRNKLMGRLDLLVSQICNVTRQELQDQEPLLIFNDKASSNSDFDGMESDDSLSSHNEWDEQSPEEEENTKAKDRGSEGEDNDDSDEPMSS